MSKIKLNSTHYSINLEVTEDFSLGEKTAKQGCRHSASRDVGKAHSRRRRGCCPEPARQCHPFVR